MENTTATPSVQKIAVDVIYIAIADKVRTDTESVGKPIHVETLGALFPDMKPEEIIDHLGEMVKIERYQDVKVYVSASGAAYLYSEKFLPASEAIEKIVAEETQGKIVDKVREDSAKTFQLTAIDALPTLFPDLEADRVQQYAQAVAGAENCPDIKQIIGPTGIAYLYSENFMTPHYASLLARAGAKNPYMTIAETVREESRVYPRPTNVALFYDPIFQIAGDQMETVVENLLRQPEYQDIKKIVATTGAIYLYSDKYLDPGAAQWQVQWEEVERHNNP
jgi:hypothetical protein